MFTDKPASNKAGVAEAINSLLEAMSAEQPESEAYAQMVDQLTKLYALKETDHKVESPRRVSADTLAIVGGNILGIVMIVGHERASVLTSKALTLLTKVR